MSHIITEHPGGIKTLSGGTRTGVKLSRPVEAGILFDPEKMNCPFHREDEKSLEEHFDGAIRVLGNPFTPHRAHKLIIPRDCTDEQFVRTLGGEKFIKQTMSVIATQARRTTEEASIGVHVLRGQNIPHLHWHFYRHWPDEEPDLDRERAWTTPVPRAIQILESDNLVVAARGVRTGQLILIPKRSLPHGVVLTEELALEVGELLHKLIELTNEAFTSAQGELPRYTVSGRLSGIGGLRYLTYVPDLQPMGCSQDLADLNGSGNSHSWSPGETTEYLKGFLET